MAYFVQAMHVLSGSSFNPRVRGTCLVSSGECAWRVVRLCPAILFQSPCAGNMFGKLVKSMGRAELEGARFNPRVRGTCLVS